MRAEAQQGAEDPILSDPYPSDSSEGPLSQANCYGCGIALQISDTQTPGYVEPEKFALKRRHRQLNQLLCARCQALSNGEMIPGVADFQQLVQIEKNDKINTTEGTTENKGEEDLSSSSSRQTGFSAKSLATPEQLRDQLRNVRSSRALVVLLVDLLDASGSMLGRVRDLVGGNPIIVVGTKVDLLPSGTNPDDVEEWLQRALEFKRIATDSVHVVSSRTGDRVAAAVAAVRKARLGRDVYIMGAANVGKSSFVRALVKDMSSMSSRQYDPLAPQRVKHLPVESAMPGTTLKTIPLQVFSSGGTLFDTPGLHLHHRVPHILTPEENKELHPRKRLRAHVPLSPAELAAAKNVGPGAGTGAGSEPIASYTWGGLGRIDVLACPPETQLVFYVPTALKVQTVSTSSEEKTTLPAEIKAENIVVGGGGDGGPGFSFGAESVASRGGLRMTREVEMLVDNEYFGSIGDIALSGVPGWVSVVAGPGRRSQSRRTRQEERSGSGVGAENVHLKIWAPVGVEVFVRPSLPVSLPEEAIPKF
jgi:nitric-oxide synthase